jgi:hypothetical protein
MSKQYVRFNKKGQLYNHRWTPQYPVYVGIDYEVRSIWDNFTIIYDHINGSTRLIANTNIYLVNEYTDTIDILLAVL